MTIVTLTYRGGSQMIRTFSNVDSANAWIAALQTAPFWDASTRIDVVTKNG